VGRGAGGGFTAPGATPWLPLSAQPGVTVEEQRPDPGSMLRLGRDLIALRRSAADLRSGGYEALPSPDGVWAYRRGGGVAVVLNLDDEAHRFDTAGFRGRVGNATGRWSSTGSILPPGKRS